MAAIPESLATPSALSPRPWQLQRARLADHTEWVLHLERLLESLTGVPTRLPAGVGEMELSGASLEFAHQPAKHFAAIRLGTPRGVLEAFCLAPDGQALLLGHRASSVSLLSAPWWQGSGLAHEEPARAPRRVPSFLSLVALLLESEELVSSSVLNEQLQAAQMEALHYQELASEQAEEIHRLGERLQALSSVAVRKVDASTNEWNPAQHAWSQEKNLARLEEWAQAHASSLVVLPRALSGAKKSLYGVPGHVYRGLEFLATSYRAYRLGELDKAAMEKALAESGCQLAGSVSPSIAGEQGEAYFVRWGGRRRFLDLHLLRGGGRDERYCLRIYFFWDDEERKVVVGWLPSHLSNSLS